MNVCIIGNGISGITAARYIRKLSDFQITVISSESKHFFSRTALMYIYMGHMKFEHTKPYEDWFWRKNKIDLVYDHVDRINFKDRSIKLRSNKAINYDKLIIATGSSSNLFDWPGQDLNNVSGFYKLQDLERIEQASIGLNRAVIVGGGLIGIELAEMFRSRNILVTFLVREASFWDLILPKQESEMINAHIIEHGVDLRLNTELKSIEDDGNGNCGAVITRTEETIKCEYVGLTVGVHPNVGFLRKSELSINKGIQVNSYLETNLDNVYAIGDCAELIQPKADRQSIEPVWYTGRMMGETVAYNICGHTTEYDPGIWFNSAKFFDIEYQVYGNIPAKSPNEHLDSIFWKYKDNKQSLRIIYDKRSRAVKGINLLGIRFRHQVCEKWIAEGSDISEVASQLAIANFDPEFCRTHEKEILRTFSNQLGIKLKPASTRKLDRVFTFLQNSDHE